MRDVLAETLFREPEGWQSGALWLALAAGLFGYAAYLAGRGGVNPTLPAVLGGAFACFGLAESLPAERRWLAGVTRTLGVLGGLGAVVVAF